MRSSLATRWWLIAGAALLFGCAPQEPLLKKLQTEKSSRVVLFVEDSPFEFTLPSGSTVGSGIPLDASLALALIERSTLASIEENNAKMNAVARQSGKVQDHRKAFVDAFVRELAKSGYAVEVVAARYENGVKRSNERQNYQPVVGSVAGVPKGAAVYLNFDAGTCGRAKLLPCVRAIVSPLENVTVKNAIRVSYAQVAERSKPSASEPADADSAPPDQGRLNWLDAELSSMVERAAVSMAGKLATDSPLIVPQ